MNSIETKEWKIINDFPNYMISNYGDIKSIKTNKILKPYITKRGYVYNCLSCNGKTYNLQVHRLVAKEFILNPLNKPCVNHIDYNPSNNYVGNLEWVTHSENCLWSKENIGKSRKGKKLTNDQKIKISKSMLNNGKDEHYIYITKNNHYMFRIRVNGVDYNKTFKNKEEAINYRDKWFKENLVYER